MSLIGFVLKSLWIRASETNFHFLLHLVCTLYCKTIATSEKIKPLNLKITTSVWWLVSLELSVLNRPLSMCNRTFVAFCFTLTMHCRLFSDCVKSVPISPYSNFERHCGWNGRRWKTDKCTTTSVRAVLCSSGEMHTECLLPRSNMASSISSILYFRLRHQRQGT